MLFSPADVFSGSNKPENGWKLFNALFPWTLESFARCLAHHAHIVQIVQIAGNSYRLKGKMAAGIAPVTKLDGQLVE
jgi:hypothetical protein